MKIVSTLGWLLFFGCLFTQAQTSQQPKPSQTNQPSNANSIPDIDKPNRIDPGKEADIRHLLDVAGVREVSIQSMDAMEGSIRPLMAQALPPGEYRDKLIDLFFVKFHAKRDPQKLLDLAVPIYDKYYSREEIRGLIEFYQTPLGQKALRTVPKTVQEMQAAGQSWGSELGRQSMLEVLAEHPDLAKALDEAKSKMQPPAN